MQIIALSLEIFVGLYSFLYLAFWRTDPLPFLHGCFHAHYFHYPTRGHPIKIQPAHIICLHIWGNGSNLTLVEVIYTIGYMNGLAVTTEVMSM